MVGNDKKETKREERSEEERRGEERRGEERIEMGMRGIELRGGDRRKKRRG